MIREARAEDLDAVRALFRDYEAWLNVDLCFQGFEAELASLPGQYAAPDGALLVALDGADYTGCVGVRRSDDHAEMKRLFVRQKWRGAGLGRQLAERSLAEARKLGYRAMRLDTLARMEAAVALYRRLGFEEIAPYYKNHLPDVVYLGRAL